MREPRDLATRSVLRRNVEVMHDVLGWSPADVEWEVYGQDRVGSAAVVRLDGSVSFDDVRAKLRAAGYRQIRRGRGAPARAPACRTSSSTSPSCPGNDSS